MLSYKQHLHPVKGKGFSLVEVVVAMGIAVSTVMVSLSLYPGGLDQMRTAGNQMATARILRWVASDLQMRDFDEWAASAIPLSYHFDSSGSPLPDGSAEDLQCVYAVRVTPQAVSETEGATIPGASTANRYLRNVSVTISDQPGPDSFSVPFHVWSRNITLVRIEKTDAG